MRSYHLDARQTTQVLDTMEQRSMIVRDKQGKSETIRPIVTPVKEKV
jgi:hypothetical protein